MNPELKVKVSRYVSYLLRHNPENLKLDTQGFVDLNEFLPKLRERYDVDRKFVEEIVEQSDRKRFEIVRNRIRALYGHSIGVDVGLEEDRLVEVLYHGTTPESASKILQDGLKPMKRRWVHLSPTKELAIEVGRRRTSKPIVLVVDVKGARKSGLEVFTATEGVYVSHEGPPEFIKSC